MSYFQRCCSFCYEPNHRLDECNNNQLFDLAIRVYNSYAVLHRNIVNNNNTTFYNVERHQEIVELDIRFNNYLQTGFTSKILKSICVRFLDGRSGLTKQHYINHITNNIDMLRMQINIIENNNQVNMIQEIMQNYLNTNGNQNEIEDITIVTSSTQVYNYTLIPRNLIENFNAESINNINNEIELEVIHNHLPIYKKTNADSCPICLEDIKLTNKVRLNCSHEYCFDCISKVITTKPKCSLCRENITKICIEDGCQQLLDNLNSLINV
jgi:hypothetical protein